MNLGVLAWVCGFICVLNGVICILARDAVLKTKARMELANKPYNGPQTPAGMVGLGAVSVGAGLLMFGFGAVKSLSLAPGLLSLTGAAVALLIGLRYVVFPVPGRDGVRRRFALRNLWAYLVIAAACLLMFTTLSDTSMWHV